MGVRRTQVVYPAGWTEEQIRAAEQIRGPEKPAKEYPFPLDAFQATSVDCLVGPSPRAAIWGTCRAKGRNPVPFILR